MGFLFVESLAGFQALTYLFCLHLTFLSVFFPLLSLSFLLTQGWSSWNIDLIICAVPLNLKLWSVRVHILQVGLQASIIGVNQEPILTTPVRGNGLSFWLPCFGVWGWGVWGGSLPGHSYSSYSCSLQILFTFKYQITVFGPLSEKLLYFTAVVLGSSFLKFS